MSLSWQADLRSREIMDCMRHIPVVLGSEGAEISETVWSIQRGVKGEPKPLPRPHSPSVGGAYPH